MAVPGGREVGSLCEVGRHSVSRVKTIQFVQVNLVLPFQCDPLGSELNVIDA